MATTATYSIASGNHDRQNVVLADGTKVGWAVQWLGGWRAYSLPLGCSIADYIDSFDTLAAAAEEIYYQSDAR